MAPISGLRLGIELPRGKKSSESIMPQPLMCLAYVQQLETSRLKLVQLELELDRTGKQVAYGGSSSLIWWGDWARICFWEGVFVGETRISSPISNLYRSVSIYP